MSKLFGDPMKDTKKTTTKKSTKKADDDVNKMPWE